MDPSRSEPAPSTTRLTQAVWFPLPRMRAGASTVALTTGTGALLCSAGLGAALVHVVEYHVGLGTVDGRQASLAFMLAHCPVRGGLLVVFVAALLTLLAVCCELRALRHQQRSLTLIARHLPVVAARMRRNSVSGLVGMPNAWASRAPTSPPALNAMCCNARHRPSLLRA